MSSASEIWEDIMFGMEGQFTPVTLKTWFDEAEGLSFEDGILTIYVPESFKKSIITEKFAKYILPLLRQATGDQTADFVVISEEDKKKLDDAEQQKKCTVIKNYTFENFIVGNSNRFAQAAAMAVASKPAAAYNPLFIYGQSGLGKTHLLYAIANQIRNQNPTASIIYIKGDEFTNELINSIKNGTVEEFRDKYRNADLFLVDDIQFVAGKERTEEEFFHTFNNLHESNKQIVLTSDRPPREMTTLEERLRTRFEWGLLADIQPPDYETRVAIISKKAENLGVTLPTDVMEYIATSIKSNVRQLEGAVKKLCALHEFGMHTITVKLAEQAMRDIMTEEVSKKPSTDLIITEVADFFSIDAAKITGSNRSKELVIPRQIAMYLVRSLTNLSLPDIGREFRRDHSTVHHSINKVEDQVNSDSVFAAKVKDIIKNIQSKQ